MTIPVITIDGPSGVGKGTISQLLASKLGWHMLDSGALYRLVGLGARRNKLDFADETALAEYARHLEVEFITSKDATHGLEIRLEGHVVGDLIRTEECGNDASRVASLAGVRTALLERQRGFRQTPGLVADGRDMGTTIFPDAALKFFLIASAEERAQRRHKQLKDKGIGVSLAALQSEISERDTRDSQRAASPLVAAEDAITIDTTNLSIEQVMDEVGRHVQRVFS